jgi:pyrroloquinoline quinone biosynthesis protein E
MLTGDPANADPVCGKSAMRGEIEKAIAYAQIPDAERTTIKPLIFRDPKESRRLIDEQTAAERQPA